MFYYSLEWGWGGAFPWPWNSSEHIPALASFPLAPGFQPLPESNGVSSPLSTFATAHPAWRDPQAAPCSRTGWSGQALGYQEDTGEVAKLNAQRIAFILYLIWLTDPPGAGEKTHGRQNLFKIASASGYSSGTCLLRRAAEPDLVLWERRSPHIILPKPGFPEVHSPSYFAALGSAERRQPGTMGKNRRPRGAVSWL